MWTSASAVLIAAVYSGVSLGANITTWKAQSIYQVLIDRFARTDGSTTPCPDLSTFCGGTWKGLINKLDYIQEMGFTAVQISPVVENMEGETAVGYPYHGYWSRNNYSTNKNFGTREDLLALSAELHKRGMLLMIDVVVNNMVAKLDSLPPKVDYSQFQPLNDEKYFHPYCNVTEWGNPQNYQNCWLYPYGVALADVKTEDPIVVEMLSTWIQELVSNYTIDGIRIDAAKHVNDEFLPQFVKASGVFASGEIVTGYKPDFCRYQSKKLLPSMPNYMEYYPLQEVFNGAYMTNLSSIRSQLHEAAGSDSCTDVLALGNFVENHDTPRFANKNKDMAVAKNAMTYVILSDGIPTVYQGQEQHFSGNSTPFNREGLWDSKYDQKAELYVLTSKLNKLRNHAIATNPVHLEKASEVLFADINHFCLKKGPYGAQIVYCINNQAVNGPKYDLSIGGFQPGDKVVEIVGCINDITTAEGNVTMHMNKGEPKVYALQSLVKNTDICSKMADARSDNKPDSKSAATDLMGPSMGALLIMVGSAAVACFL